MIDSIKSQEHENWELFIVDDGSTDETKFLLSSLNDERITYFSFEENRGHPVAIYESGVLERLTGDIVSFIGSDDYFKDDIFKIIISIFNNEPSEVWKIGFFFDTEDGLLHEDHNRVITKSFLSNEIMSDKYVQSDYLFFYRNIFWKKFMNYFRSPKDFFRSFYDVAMNNLYLEKLNELVVLTGGWGEDNITKGKNADIYFEWSLFTRQYLFDNYKDNMGKKYYRYTLNSLIRNLLIFKGRKKDSFPYIFLGLKNLSINFLDSFTWLIYLIIPSPILNQLKKLFLKIKTKR